MMTPAIVFDRGRLRACVGAPGGTKMVSAPRVDFQGDVVQVEARSPLVVSQGLEKAGFARPQLVVAESDGFLHGASDPRKDDGTALDTETV